MKRLVPGLLGVLAAAALPACGGSAVLIARTAHGGIVGLDGDRDQAMADARRQMSEACGGAYTIVAERNAFAGTYHGRPLTEHQIRYACGPSSRMPPPGPQNPNDL
jgi:hypothetical protein